jgi:O-antigen ligase/tetratricopeptide (TPR) repeat protein
MIKPIQPSFIKKSVVTIFFCLLVIYAIVFSGYEINPFTAFMLVLVAIFLVFKPVYVPRKIFISGLIFLTVLMISTFFSISARRSIEQLWIILAAILVMLVLANINDLKTRQNQFLFSILSVGLFWMILSWRDTIHWYLTWRSTTLNHAWIPDIPYRLNGGNTIAAFYAILFFICLGLILKSRVRLQQVLLGIYLLSVSILIFLTSSRGAWLGIIMGLICLMILELKFLKNLFVAMKEKRWVLWTLGIVVVLGVGGILFVYLQVLGSHPNHVPGLGVRAPFWVPAWKGFLESPVIGNGLYTGGTYFILSTSIPWQEIYLHAHNTYLDILRDTGVLGFISFTVLIVVVFRFVLMKYKQNENVYDLISLCSLASFLGHSIFDGVYLMPFAAVSLMLLLGLSLNPDGRHYPATKIPIGLKLIFSMMVIIGAIFLSWNRANLNKAIDAYQDGDLITSYQRIEKSAQFDSLNPIAHIYQGLLASQLSIGVNDLYFSKAIHAIEKALVLDPNWAVSHANLGALYLKKGEIEKAKEQFILASKLSPDWYIPVLNLGMLFETEGNLELAKEYYEVALTKEPGISQSFFWRINEFRISLIEVWVENHPITNYTYLDYDQISKQAFALPMIQLGLEIVDEDITLAEKLLTKSRLTVARYAFIHAERLWLEAEIQYHKNNLQEAIRLADLAIDNTKREGIYGPGSAGKSLYYDGVYRASVIPIDFVPQLVIISLPGEWENRYYQLAEWNASNQDYSGCKTILEELIMVNPDFLAYNHLNSPCGDN